MFELEVDHASFPESDLPAAARARFAESSASVTALAILPWEEHCTECAMPQCYSSCDLYEPRKDGKCRRFRYGSAFVRLPSSILGYVACISFKRWGALLAYANLQLVPVARAQKIIHAISGIDRAVARIPDRHISIRGRRGISSRLMRRAKQRLTHSAWFTTDRDVHPDSFVAEVYNPRSEAVEVSLVFRDFEGPLRDTPYQELLRVVPGFNRFRIPFPAIAPHIDPTRQFLVSLCPNILDPADEGLTLYVGLLSFVSETAALAPQETTAQDYQPGLLPEKTKYVKVVAWDLDHTLWDGILLEDGEEKIRLKPGIADLIRELDRRGIVNSVVSKNDAESTLPVLQRLGLAEFFVFPKIGWEPKSVSVAELIEAFNVGADTVVLMDDSPFERAEVRDHCPGVRVYDAERYAELLALPEFRPALSAESSRRRAYYRADERRAQEKKGFSGDYLSFLRGCLIHISVRRTTRENVARAHELIQRTNQLNFSGNRYSRDAIEQLIVSPHMLPLSIHCHDRFGDYGLVGFCLLDTNSMTVVDLMFSCRVQAKHVEHAFLGRLMEFLRENGIKNLHAVYRRTDRNPRTAKVFDDLGFSLTSVDETGILHVYAFDLGKQPHRQDVVTVDWEVNYEMAENGLSGGQDAMASGG